MKFVTNRQSNRALFAKKNEGSSSILYVYFVNFINAEVTEKLLFKVIRS